MHPLAGQRHRDRARRWLLLVPLCLAACGATRPLRPLAEREMLLSASVGGPLVEVSDVVLPTPMLMVAGAYGLGPRWAATGELGLTAALYGNLHVNPGVMYYPLTSEQGTSVAVGGSIHAVTDLGAILVAPQVVAVASWWLGGRYLVHAGADAAVPIGSPTRVLAGPLFGVEIGRGPLRFGLETKWLAPYHDVEPLAPSWVSPAHQGYLSVLLSLSYRRQRGR